MGELVLTTPKGKELSIPDERAKEIAKSFIPLYEEFLSHADEYKDIISRPIDKDTIAQSKALLKKLVPIRTEISRVHKAEKESARNEGLFIDAFKNEHKKSSEEVEAKLKYIADTDKRLEQERLDKIRKQRENILSEYRDNFPPDLATMDEDVFQAVLMKAKSDHQEMLAEEEAQRQRQVKQDKYNRRLIEVAKYGDSFDRSKLTLDTTGLEWMQMIEKAESLHLEKVKEVERLKEIERKAQEEKELQAIAQQQLLNGSNLEKALAFQKQLSELTVPHLEGMDEFNKSVPSYIDRVTGYVNSIVETLKSNK